MHGQFIWYDLMTPDVAGAQRFYATIAGWKAEKFPHSSPDNPYTVWSSNGKALGGVAAISPDQRAMGVRPHWLASVQVNNVDETIRKATSLGGRAVMGPMEIPETGRYAILADPQGAHIAIYQPHGPSEGFDGTPVVGRHSWTELMTTDFRRGFEFYRQLFGWEKVSEMDMGGGMVYFTFGKNGNMYGGMYDRPAEMAGVPPFWLPYINVKDAKQTTEVARRAGATVKRGPMEIPGGWITVMEDPQGATFAVHSVGPAAATSKASKPKAKRAAKAKAKVKSAAKRVAKRVKKAVAKVKTKARAARAKLARKPKAKPRAKPKARRAKKARRR